MTGDGSPGETLPRVADAPSLPSSTLKLWDYSKGKVSGRAGPRGSGSWRPRVVASPAAALLAELSRSSGGSKPNPPGGGWVGAGHGVPRCALHGGRSRAVGVQSAVQH